MSTKKRHFPIGALPVGPKNHITDVDGVLVGHTTIHHHNNHTGVTAILPHAGNMFTDKVVAGVDVFNGFGKSVGIVQLLELGVIETPILLTNTVSVGTVTDALVSYMHERNPKIANEWSTVNPLVMECNDSGINDIRSQVITRDHVFEAIDHATAGREQGSIGAGTGMKCHGFKGGIGSSSRRIYLQDKTYHLGVMVNSNFHGNTSKYFRLYGNKIHNSATQKVEIEDKGSIIIVIATDAYLESNQLRRLAKRAILGVARTGSIVSHGSGDIACAFSTKNRKKQEGTSEYLDACSIEDNQINVFFEAVVDATEEAILNSMMESDSITGFDKKEVQGLKKYIGK